MDHVAVDMRQWLPFVVQPVCDGLRLPFDLQDSVGVPRTSAKTKLKSFYEKVLSNREEDMYIIYTKITLRQRPGAGIKISIKSSMDCRTRLFFS